MAVVERERAPTRSERAIFVAADGRRARRLRRAGFALAFVACLWVVGLGVGMLGFGSLPGVSVVKKQIGGIAGAPDSSRSERTKPVSPPERKSIPEENRLVVTPSANREDRPQRQPRAGTRPVASKPASRPPVRVTPAPAPPAAQAPVNPATRQRGWSRRGNTAPPGKVRQTVPPPPPGTRGQRRGQDPTAPPPVPRGQEKKALEGRSRPAAAYPGGPARSAGPLDADDGPERDAAGCGWGTARVRGSPPRMGRRSAGVPRARCRKADRAHVRRRPGPALDPEGRSRVAPPERASDVLRRRQ